MISSSVTPSTVVSRGKRNKIKKNKTRLHTGGFPWAGVGEIFRVVQACMNPPVNPQKEVFRPQNNGYFTTGYSGPNNGPPMTSPNAAGARIYNREDTAQIPVTAAFDTELSNIL